MTMISCYSECVHDHDTMLQWVCQKSSVMRNTKDKLGRTPLLLALMSHAEVEAVTVLVEEGEMVDMEDEVGR